MITKNKNKIYMLVKYLKWGPFRAKIINGNQLIEACVDGEESTISQRSGEGYVDAYKQYGTEITEYEYNLIFNQALDTIKAAVLNTEVVS
jgi:hypothetical protein